MCGGSRTAGTLSSFRSPPDTNSRRTGTAILGAIGNGPETGEGQFTESSYMAMDAQGNLYTGDTAYPRITKLVAPRK